MNDASFKLTKKLYKRQQSYTPVTLNSMIACVLLYSKENEITMKQLLESTGRIYEYMK